MTHAAAPSAAAGPQSRSRLWAADEARLTVDGVSKRFGGVQALRSASFTVGPGQILGLVGANGAGKSTLIRILGGVIGADAGTIRLDGEEVALRSPHEALEHGIAVIHQELQLVGAQTIAENIFLGRERPKRFGALDWRSLNRGAVDAFARLEIEIDVAKPVDEASTWERWATTIARALTDRRRLLILDEPTAAMDNEEVEKVFRAVRGARDQGCSVIFVSHRLDEVLGLCDRVHAMRDGQTVADVAAADQSRQKLIHLITGERPEEVEAPPTVAAGGEVPAGAALLVENLTVARRARSVSFRVEPGEIVGLAGLVGSGRSTILRALAGCERATGTVRVGGEELRLGSPGSARALRIGLVPEDRIEEGLIHSFTVAENIAFGRRVNREAGGIVVHHGAETSCARTWIEKLSIAGGGPEADVLSLSGGNQQKTLFARTLERGVRVLLLDEPTRGVDVGAKADLLGLVEEFAREGGVCVVSLSDLDELVEVSDRVIVLREGAVVGVLTEEKMNPNQILEELYDHG
ncbi:MAG: sugar ABC transporter ATP-binding protein [Actinobacteria bacterium]|nr:sugar ABC transporter ATP-binding protein [Actinomycetota bacterium]